MKKLISLFLAGMFLACPAVFSQALLTDTDITNKSINTSREIGVTAGSAGVSLSGSSTYSIPVLVPCGINGMAQDVSIQYSSGSGNGLLGYGWSLSATSSIGYDTRDLYFDDFPEPKHITNKGFGGAVIESSPFLLNGERLIPYNGSTTEFRTESESFSVLAPDKLYTFFKMV